MTATWAFGARQRVSTWPARSAEELSTRKADAYCFVTSPGRRMVEAPGRKASVSGSGDSSTTSAVFPISCSACLSPREEPTASPSGSTCDVMRNSFPAWTKGSKPSKAASLIPRLLHLEQEVLDPGAPLDGMVHLELELGNDSELEARCQKAPEIGRGAPERLQYPGLLLRLQASTRHPDLRDREIAVHLRRGDGERAETRILRTQAQDLGQLDLDAIGDAPGAWALGT